MTSVLHDYTLTKELDTNGDLKLCAASDDMVVVARVPAARLPLSRVEEADIVDLMLFDLGLQDGRSIARSFHAYRIGDPVSIVGLPLGTAGPTPAVVSLVLPDEYAYGDYVCTLVGDSSGRGIVVRERELTRRTVSKEE